MERLPQHHGGLPLLVQPTEEQRLALRGAVGRSVAPVERDPRHQGRLVGDRDERVAGRSGVSRPQQDRALGAVVESAGNGEGDRAGRAGRASRHVYRWDLEGVVLVATAGGERHRRWTLPPRWRSRSPRSRLVVSPLLTVPRQRFGRRPARRWLRRGRRRFGDGHERHKAHLLEPRVATQDMSRPRPFVEFRGRGMRVTRPERPGSDSETFLLLDGQADEFASWAEDLSNVRCAAAASSRARDRASSTAPARPASHAEDRHHDPETRTPASGTVPAAGAGVSGGLSGALAGGCSGDVSVPSCIPVSSVRGGICMRFRVRAVWPPRPPRGHPAARDHRC